MNKKKIKFNKLLPIIISIVLTIGIIIPAISLAEGEDIIGEEVVSAEEFVDVGVQPMWSIKVYTVNFVDWDSTVLSTQNIEHGSPATAPSNPFRDGYFFVGWDTDFSAITGDTIVTALYEVMTHTVTFETGGGTNIGAQIIEHGKTATKPQDPVRQGYVFNGWTEFDVPYYFDKPVTTTTSIKAEWIPVVYHVIYSGNGFDGGHEPVDNNTYMSGDSHIVLDNEGGIFRDRHVFMGWNTKSDGTGVSYKPGDQFSVTEETTLYAQWMYIEPVEKQTLDVMANDVTYVYGDAVPVITPTILNPGLLFPEHTKENVEAAISYTYPDDTLGKSNSMMRKVSFTLSEEYSEFYNIRVYDQNNRLNDVTIYASQRPLDIIWGSGEHYIESNNGAPGTYELVYGDTVPNLFNNIDFANALEEDRNSIPFKITDTVNIYNYVWDDVGDLAFGERGAMQIADVNSNARLGIGVYSFQVQLNSASDLDANGVKGSHMKYKNKFGLANMYIMPKEVSVTPDDKAKIYGEEDPILTGSHSELAYGEEIDFKYHRVPGETIGTYDIDVDNFGYNDYKNYDISYNSAELVINKRNLTLVGNSGEFQYNGDNHIVDEFTVEGLLSTDTISGVEYIAERTNVGNNDGIFNIDNIKIVDKDGNDVTYCYNINTRVGEIVVTLILIPSPEPSSEPSSIPSSEPSTTPSTEPSVEPSTEQPSEIPAVVAPVETIVVPVVINPTTSPIESVIEESTIEPEPAIEPTLQPIDEVESTTIDDALIPLFGLDGIENWSLFDLIMTIATVICFIALLISYFFDKKKTDDNGDVLKKRFLIRLLGILFAIANVLFFLLTQNIYTPIVIFDEWSVWFAVILIGQLITMYLIRKRKRVEKH